MSKYKPVERESKSQKGPDVEGRQTEGKGQRLRVNESMHGFEYLNVCVEKREKGGAF